MNKKDLIERIRLPEWSDIEFKEARVSLPKNIWQTVSAFSNTDGGYIVLGIKETAKNRYEPAGVESVDKIQNDFVTTLRGEKFNIQLSSRGDLIDMDGKLILVFKITPMPRQAKPVYFNNDIRNTYIRMGSTDQRCGKGEIERMLREASEQTSDSLILHEYDASHVDSDTVTGFRRYLEVTEKSQKNWQEAGFPAPVIRNNQPRYWFTLELEMKKPAVAGDVLGEKVGDKVGEKVGDRLTENQVNILNLLKNNPKISAKQLASQVGISQRKIEENLAKLKSKGVIDRIGPAKGGRWVVKVAAGALPCPVGWRKTADT